ncbi:hypothetical protein FB451DRAFT_1028165 [Mycena latifolia]|nr:hypothetical protein FB451DRAFT_1028165 [Mycena latifolia]
MDLRTCASTSPSSRPTRTICTPNSKHCGSRGAAEQRPARAARRREPVPLLLTIYRSMDKNLGVDRTPVRTLYLFFLIPLTHADAQKGGAETKLFTNFGVFHDNLITRLKSLSQIQVDFDRRAKEVEACFADKLNVMRKQLDMRWKQIDKYEADVKGCADAKFGWRRKLSSQGGLGEGASPMASWRARASRGGPTRWRCAHSALVQPKQSGASTTRRTKVAVMNQKSTAADAKWEARVRKSEARLTTASARAARSTWRSSRTTSSKCITPQPWPSFSQSPFRSHPQFNLTQKRNQRLNEVVEAAKLPPSCTNLNKHMSAPFSRRLGVVFFIYY